MRKIIVSQESKALLKEVCQNSLSPVFKQLGECILLTSNLGLIAPKFCEAKQYFGLLDFKNYKEQNLTNFINISFIICIVSKIILNKHQR